MHGGSITGLDMPVPALVRAIHYITRVWIRDLPATPARVLKALHG